MRLRFQIGTQLKREPHHGCKDDIGHQAMNIVNGRQTRKTDVTAVLQHAQFTPNLEALRKVHGGPPATLALGEGGASQHRVIGTDPAAQNHLCSQQGHRAPQGPTHPLAQTDRRQTPGRLFSRKTDR
jgi:hypothetical protein